MAAETFTVDPQVAYSAGDMNSIKYTYKNADGNFHIDGEKGKAIYKWHDGNFYSDALEFNRMAILRPGGDEGYIYRVPNENFYILFGSKKYNSSDPAVGEFFTLYYSYDGSTFKRWLTQGGTDRLALQITVPNLPGAGGTSGTGGTGTGGSGSPGKTTPDGKKPVFPIVREAKGARGYAQLTIEDDGSVTLYMKVDAPAGGSTTRYVATGVITGYKDNDINNILTSKIEPQSLTVAPSVLSKGEKDRTWILPSIKPEDLEKIRHVKVFLERDKSEPDLLKQVVDLMRNVGEAWDAADTLYKKVKHSELGQDIAVALVAA